MKKITEIEIKKIAEQLMCPNGDFGVEIGNLMQDSNSSMIFSTLSRLNISENDTILELGPGNGFHFKSLLDICLKLYTVDISKLMIDEIRKNYHKEIQNKKLVALLGDGSKLNISDGLIDKGFSVNTIYFWKDSKKYIKEISRTLKTNGEFYITYVHEDSMKDIPFTKYGFCFYNEQKIEQLCLNTDLKVIGQKRFSEKVLSKVGDFIEREFVIAKLVKN